jgi:putative PIN family toxin of toxin-antitoxin system
MNVTNIRVMFDSNVLISAILNRHGTPNKAYLKVAKPPYVLVLCDQILVELRRIFSLKFPSKINDMQLFLSTTRYDLITLVVGDSTVSDEHAIRDVNDRPILRAARKGTVDIFVTGDKDFLESGVSQPRIITAAEFLNADTAR